jgi:hypothetical protein
MTAKRWVQFHGAAADGVVDVVLNIPVIVYRDILI